MRTMMTAQIPVDKGNAAIADGSLVRIIQETVARIHPEASYFLPLNGKRAAIFVFDMSDASQIPVIAEPLFAGLDAEVSFTPVMNADDLQKGLGG